MRKPCRFEQLARDICWPTNGTTWWWIVTTSRTSVSIPTARIGTTWLRLGSSGELGGANPVIRQADCRRQIEERMTRKEAIKEYKARKIARGVFAVRCTTTGHVWIDAALNLEAARN